MIKDFGESIAPNGAKEGRGREKLAYLEVKGPNCKEENLERKNGAVWILRKLCENPEQNSTLDKLSSKNVMSEVCEICISQHHFSCKEQKKENLLVHVTEDQGFGPAFDLPLLAISTRAPFSGKYPSCDKNLEARSFSLHKILRNPGNVLELSFGFRYARPGPCLSWKGVDRIIDN